MKTTSLFAALAIVCLHVCGSAAPAMGAAAARQRLLMDANWRFTLNDPADAGQIFEFPEGRDLVKAHSGDATREASLATQRSDPVATNLGASVSFVQPRFDDSAWRTLDLPHDWCVELPIVEAGQNSHGSHEIGPTLGNTIGWYRRRFDLPAENKGSEMWIEFDGVYRNSIVWLNGHCLGRSASGYASFWYEISRYANCGGSNELVVRVDATRPESWFYEGTGIYRHVWLVKTAPVHIAHWGTFVTSTIWGENATVTARATVRNDAAEPADIDVTQTLIDAEGKTVAGQSSRGIKLTPGEEREISLDLPVYKARLWSPDAPNLYKLQTTISENGATLDSFDTSTGIRTLNFDPDQGFFLNGKHLEIQGVCNHQDHAGVGSALPDRLQYFRVEKLKEMGANAYRTSNYDPTPELLDACDKLGLLVMDEHREMGVDDERLAQLRRLVMRDRNHPSVFMWCLGNEESVIQGSPLGAQIATVMQNLVHSLDPTRPCTAAMNNSWGRGISNVIDVQGFNYLRQGDMDAFHKTFPAKPMIGTEEASTFGTRGAYTDDRAKSWESAYDVDAPRSGSTAEHWWSYYLNRPYLAGAFVRTGFDYRGEPTPYRWPAVGSQYGIMDTCGFPKDEFYYYQAWWTEKPVLHLLPHWNWPGQEGQAIDVWCYSNLPEVELFLNGRSQGRMSMPPVGHLSWKVLYSPGVLEAKAYKGGEFAAATRVETAGAPAKIMLTPDRLTIDADGRDVTQITVAVTDAQGLTVPVASNLIHFVISGGGKLIGVGNGDPASHESDKDAQRHVFNGLCAAIVQAGRQAGVITVTATGEGLATATVMIQTTPAAGVAEVP